ncbi:GNAT family N-acetyltransferase [Tritonibacter horizontis]|uniref:Acetyltransferase (GNAT) family protein n=1 Tax=Tritonibacter horizontis TaxID=1768241 RepID=A0A132C092_9RHOB|nr:GNAT family N-acetyltransferase [Tritonibacter horizontis]KUP93517.1 acetyltransferase (GNAT) family protein [Tritonibacter horizontis]
MKISPLAAQDAAGLVPLLQDLHALHVAHQPARYPADPAPEALADWLQDWLLEPGTEALVARSPTGAVMGYLLYEIEDRAALPVRSAERRAMVHHIAVAGPFQRIGVGKALMSEMRQRALDQGATVIGVTYAPFNTASAALMRGHGLEPVMTVAEWRPAQKSA